MPSRPSARMARLIAQIVGLYPHEIITYTASQARRKELTIINLHRSAGTTGQALKLIQDAQVDVASLVTHRFSLGGC